MKALQLLREGIQSLAGTADAEWDARALLMEALKIPDGALVRHLPDEVQPEQVLNYRALLSRRAQGEPTQYILGCAGFMGLDFFVDARVLIPRQDTELLCEKALAYARARDIACALDLCTGSGALAVALGKLGGMHMTATDLSADALEVARGNARRQDVDIDFYQGDLFDALPKGAKYPLIVCNPPYLTREDMNALQKEVRAEPVMALAGGEDGLEFYRRLSREAGEYLTPGGCLMMEIGCTQAGAVQSIFAQWSTQVRCDLNGLDRVVQAVRK